MRVGTYLWFAYCPGYT